MHKNKRKDCFKQTVLIFLSLSGDRVKRKSYVSNACLLVVSTVLVKVISVLYKIPLTSLIGATGRGYFGIAYNLFIPFHAVCIYDIPLSLPRYSRIPLTIASVSVSITLWLTTITMAHGIACGGRILRTSLAQRIRLRTLRMPKSTRKSTTHRTKSACHTKDRV